MFGLFQWFQKRSEQRQLIKARKIEAREVKRRIKVMDPLIGARVFNNRCCPLFARLPEELLVCIIDSLRRDDDAIALECLRLVSSTFFRLLDRQAFNWKDSWYRGGGPPSTDALPMDQMLIFRWHLQRDGRCNICRQWIGRHYRGLFRACKFEGLSNDGEMYLKLWCDACHNLHDKIHFSYIDQLPQQQQRWCVGQKGSVQLCEHVQITWAVIKAHIEDCREHQRRGEDWRACLDSFIIECHDASHDTRCTASEAPTCPRARLSVGTSACSNQVLLILEWAPHCRIDPLALTADGRIPAPDLRALFRRVRRLGPADTLYPPCRPGALPEMSCFSPSSCGGSLVYYKTGEDDEIVDSPAAPLPLSFERCLVLSDHYGLGENGRKLEITPHCPDYQKDASLEQLLPCLMVCYRKDLMVCKTAVMTNPAIDIIPTLHWVHAMNTDTYSHPEYTHIRPLCKNSTCANYYRRLRDCRIHRDIILSGI